MLNLLDISIDYDQWEEKGWIRIEHNYGRYPSDSVSILFENEGYEHKIGNFLKQEGRSQLETEIRNILNIN